MKIIHRLTVLFFLAAVLSGCTLELPAPISASVERYAKGAPVQTWRLSDPQLAALSEWFAQHQSGWSPSYVSYVPNVEVTVQHAAGKQSYINVWSTKRVVVNSGGRQVEQDFEASAVQSLLAVVEAHGG